MTEGMFDFFLGARLREGRGDRTAVIVDRDGVVARHSYAEIATRAERYAHALVRAGVRPEERVILSLEDGVDFVAAFFGILASGAVVVMVNPELRGEEAAYFFGYSRARVAITGGSRCPRVSP